MFGDIIYYDAFVSEIDLTNIEGNTFFVHIKGQVRAIGVTDNYVGSTSFIFKKNSPDKSFQIQVQGSNPRYSISVYCTGNKIKSSSQGDIDYGIAGQIVAIN